MERAPHRSAGPARPVSTDGTASLPALRADFPHFRIWQEITGDRVRYVARRLAPGTGPHTLVTADPDELYKELAGAPARPARPAGRLAQAAVPNIARVYDRWLGGKDNYEADRIAADSVLAEYPGIAAVARANRRFVTRAVAYAAAQGITQFADIGAGLPATPAIHNIARHHDPAARTAYIDNDPVVLAHARALLAKGPGVTALAGDLRQPKTILDSRELHAVIDFQQPVCVILAAVLHFLTPTQADTAVSALVTAMAPGSFLIVSAGTSTGTSPDLINRLTAAYAGTTVVTGRSDTEIAAYFTGLHLIPPGLTDVHAWRPDTQRYWPPPPTARILGAVGRKPPPAGTPAEHQRQDGHGTHRPR